MRNKLNLFLLAFVLHTQIEMSYSASSNTTFFDSHCPTIKLPECEGVGNATEIGWINDTEISEGSGLAISSINDKLFWIIQDSEKPPIVFGVHENGDTVVKVTLDEADNNDWEAITTAPCKKNSNQMCIYVADIGDNCRDRDHITIYKFNEPHINNVENLRNKVQEIKIKQGNWTLFNLTYPDERHNCESIIIDPKTRDLILFTKGDKPPRCSNTSTFGNNSKVYSAPVDTTEGTSVELKDEKIVVHFPLNILKNNSEEVATDASISKDGNILIVRTNSSASIYRKESHLTVLEMLRNNEPCVKKLDYQPQGEGVSIQPDGKAFYIHSEYKNIKEMNLIYNYTLECGPNHC